PSIRCCTSRARSPPSSRSATSGRPSSRGSPARRVATVTTFRSSRPPPPPSTSAATTWWSRARTASPTACAPRPAQVPAAAASHRPLHTLSDLPYYTFCRAPTGPMTRDAATLMAPWLRRWDVATAPRVHAFVANSAYVAGRIHRYYGREAMVIPPPVDTEFFT